MPQQEADPPTAPDAQAPPAACSTGGSAPKAGGGQLLQKGTQLRQGEGRETPNCPASGGSDQSRRRRGSDPLGGGRDRHPSRPTSRQRAGQRRLAPRVGGGDLFEGGGVASEPAFARQGVPPVFEGRREPQPLRPRSPRQLLRPALAE